MRDAIVVLSPLLVCAMPVPGFAPGTADVAFQVTVRASCRVVLEAEAPRTTSQQAPASHIRGRSCNLLLMMSLRALRFFFLREGLAQTHFVDHAPSCAGCLLVIFKRAITPSIAVFSHLVSEGSCPPNEWDG